jgi:hypothetical protein
MRVMHIFRFSNAVFLPECLSEICQINLEFLDGLVEFQWLLIK